MTDFYVGQLVRWKDGSGRGRVRWITRDQRFGVIQTEGDGGTFPQAISMVLVQPDDDEGDDVVDAGDEGELPLGDESSSAAEDGADEEIWDYKPIEAEGRDLLGGETSNDVGGSCR